MRLNRLSPIIVCCAAVALGIPGAGQGSEPRLITYQPGDKPSVLISLRTLLEEPVRKTRTLRIATPTGPVSVTLHPPRPSGLPPAREAEISWPITHLTAVIRSPSALPVKIWLPVWSNRSSQKLTVNGKAVQLESSVSPPGYWTGTFPGGYQKVIVPVTDAE